MPLADDAAHDEADSQWLSSFMGQSIPTGATIEGFVSVISYMDDEGEMRWRMYSTIENAIRAIGLLTAAAHNYSTELRTED
jgi:hypothetical protein